jgi:hypothetical protein
VIFTCSAFSDECPVSVLFPEIETGGVGNKELSDDPSGESEPADNPESGSCVDVVVENSGDESTEFTSGGR